MEMSLESRHLKIHMRLEVRWSHRSRDEPVRSVLVAPQQLTIIISVC